MQELFDIPKFELNPETGHVTVAIRNMAFPELMQRIADATGQTIDWDPILNEHKTTVGFNALPVNEALPKLLSGLNFAYDNGRLRVFAPPGYETPAQVATKRFGRGRAMTDAEMRLKAASDAEAAAAPPKVYRPLPPEVPYKPLSEKEFRELQEQAEGRVGETNFDL